MPDHEDLPRIGTERCCVGERPGDRVRIVLDETRELDGGIKTVVRHHDDGAPGGEGQRHERVERLVAAAPAAAEQEHHQRPARLCRAVDVQHVVGPWFVRDVVRHHRPVVRDGRVQQRRRAAPRQRGRNQRRPNLQPHSMVPNAQPAQTESRHIPSDSPA